MMMHFSSLRQTLWWGCCLLALQFSMPIQAAEPPAEKEAADRASALQIRHLISNSTLAAAWIRPSALVRNTEFNVLGDIPFLKLIPVPLSEMEEVAVWGEWTSRDEGPNVYGAIRFHHDIYPATYLQWLASKAVRIPDREFPSFRHGENGGWDLVQLDSRTILMLANADSVTDLLTAGRENSDSAELPQHLRSLPEDVNLALSMDVGRIRFFADTLALDEQQDSLHQLFLTIPAELSHLHLTVGFARKTNRFELEFTKRSDVTDQQGLERWLPQANQTVMEIARWGAAKMRSRLNDSEGERVTVLEEVFLQQAEQFQQMPDSPRKWHHPQSPSISRAMKGVTLVLEPFVMLARRAAYDMMQQNNLKQLLLAWHMCNDKESALPANIGNSKGEAVLSWRVRLLPYLGEEELYAKFHLEEPWNSPHNLTLLAEMPSVYRNLRDPSGKPVTHWRAWSGPDSVFGEGAQFAQVSDGLSNTLALIETAEPLPWTQPDDFIPPAENISSQLRVGVEGKFLIGFLDGHVERRALNDDQIWRQLADYNDGGVIQLDQQISTDAAAKPTRSLPECLEQLKSISPQDRTMLRPLLAELYQHAGQLTEATLQPAITGVALPPEEQARLTASRHSIRNGVLPLLSSPDLYVRHWTFETYRRVQLPDGPKDSPLAVLADDNNPDLRSRVRRIFNPAPGTSGTDVFNPLMLGWHNHYDLHQQFPRNIVSPEGTPLLSWRVQLLPLLGYDDLYEKFHLNEAWDSPHNRELIRQLPQLYATAGRAADDWTTRIQAVTGPGTVFTDRVKFQEITDGTSNTLALVEAENGVVWTKPEDFSIPAEKIASMLWRRASGQFTVALMDGLHRSFSSISDEEFRRLATYAGGELSLEQQRAELLEKFKAELDSETPGQALVTAREILKLEEQIFGESHQMVLDTMAWLANNSTRLGDPDGCRHFLELRAERMKAGFGPTDQRTVEAQLDLAFYDQQQSMTSAQKEAQTQAEALKAPLTEALQRKEFPQALEVAVQRLSLLETAHGPESLQALEALKDCWEVCAQGGDLEKAIGYAERTVALVRILFKDQHPGTIQQTAKLGLLLNRAGYSQRALDQLTASYDAIPKSAEPVTALGVCELLGRNAIRQGQYEQGRKYFYDGVFICDRNQGPHRAVLLCRTLGTLLAEARQFELGIASLYEAIWRAEQTDSPLQFRENYRELAAVFAKTGQTHLELVLRQVALQLVDQAIPSGQVRIIEQALAVLELGDNYVQLGDFVNAERYYSLLLSVFKRANPEALPPLQGVLGLASVEEFQNRPDQEEFLLKQAVDILKKNPEINDVLRRNCHRRMADFCARQGRLAEAIAGYQELLTLHKDTHSGEALQDRIHLAQLQQQSGEQEAATTLAKEIQAELDGPRGQQLDHLVLHDLANLLQCCGDRQGAMHWSQQARAMCQSRFGRGNRRDVESLLKAAVVSLQCGERTLAAAQAREAMNGSREILDVSMYILSPRQRVQLREHLRDSLDLLITIESENESPSAELFDTIYQWKGDAQLRQRNLQELMEHAEVKSFQEQISQISNRVMRINQAMVQVPQTEEQEAHAQAEAQARMLSDLKESIEQQLSASQLAYLDQMSRQPLEQFLKTLPASSAFIDYFAYRKMTANHAGPPDHLLATVVRPGGEMKTVPLGPLNEIQKEIENWRKTYGRGEAGIEAGKRLRARIWEPVAAHLADANLVLISPDADLGLLPFNALPGKEPGKYLLQEVRLATVSVPQLTGEMLKPLSGTIPADAMLLIGDIDYNAGLKSEKPAVAPDDALMGSIRGGASFQALPGTSAEVQAINDLRRQETGSRKQAAQTLLRQQATESAFRKLAPNSRILHVATHGFFAPPRGHSVTQQGEQVHDNALSASVTIESYHPGLLSGLALAGANTRDAASEDDGILTADEIAALPLSGVDLAVLSACETGIGKVTHGDGLIGVQRAFQIAGARSTISSLWKVNDHATQILMTRFYQNLWSGANSRLDALRDAQIWMLEHPQEVWKSASAAARGIDRVPSIEEEQLGAKQLSPEFWGAFILSGNWQ